MTDMETWLLDVGYDRIFRLLEYKKIFTPYEQQQAFFDESEFKDIHYSFIKIVECFKLPNHDVMIGYREIIDIDDLDKPENEWHIEYRNLKDIQLAYFAKDMNEENWE